MIFLGSSPFMHSWADMIKNGAVLDPKPIGGDISTLSNGQPVRQGLKEQGGYGRSGICISFPTFSSYRQHSDRPCRGEQLSSHFSPLH